MLNFLAEAVALDGIDTAALAGGALGGGLVAMVMGCFLFIVLILLAFYIYISLAFMGIAKKNKQSSPGLAWIPIVGPPIVAAKAAEMHWWPILLLVGAMIPFIGFVFSITFAVFFVIWMWKTFEAVDKPGWWAIFQVIPLLNIVWFVFIGIAAWSD